MNKGVSTPRGFTIVELLIVIVVIAILAAITIVAYNGIQQRSRDSRRQSDIAYIVKLLELYHTDNGQYPVSSGSTTINNSWSSTSDSSWQNLVSQLSSYGVPPIDPVATPGQAGLNSSNGYNYNYYANKSNYCGSTVGNMYIIVFRLEGSQKYSSVGDCTTNPVSYSSSYYRVAK